MSGAISGQATRNQHATDAVCKHRNQDSSAQILRSSRHDYRRAHVAIDSWLCGVTAFKLPGMASAVFCLGSGFSFPIEQVPAYATIKTVSEIPLMRGATVETTLMRFYFHKLFEQFHRLIGRLLPLALG